MDKVSGLIRGLLSTFAWTLRHITYAPLGFRLMGLFSAVLLSNLVIGMLRRFQVRSSLFPPSHSRKPGISVIIPERANVSLLEKCLESVFTANRQTNEPIEVIVVVNGSPKSDYHELIHKFGTARWSFAKRPLGFVGAIRKGLRMASLDWVYLLNNDMVLEPDALSEVMRWRGPRVFAVASQIFFIDTRRRREETGWTDMRTTAEGIEIFDALPEDDSTVRGTLYAGGGASLFNRNVLQRLISTFDPYYPFYWEDVEWGFRAWAKGYEVLFCPSSKCWHHHRATVGKFYSPEEIDRVFARNGMQFELRNLLGTRNTMQQMKRIIRMGTQTRREMGHPINCLGVLVARIRTSLAPVPVETLEFVRRKFYFTPHGERKPGPLILVITPYAVFPPTHGGAVRITGLLGELCRKYDILMLSDEELLYSSCGGGAARFAHVHSLHLVGGRPDKGVAPDDRIERIKSHCHAKLRHESNRLLRVWKPDIVQVEYIELAGLANQGKRHGRWIISLHDVLLSEQAETPADQYEKALISRFDEVIVCSHEDAALIPDRSALIVPNGTDIDQHAYVSSVGSRSILFMGPFRYSLNLSGIRRFLESVYPRLLLTVSRLEIVILGGHGASELAERWDCFGQPGVRIIDEPVNPGPFLKKCAVTINPLYGMRGSSLKLIESIASGRVCVSTRDGARGFLQAEFPSLIVLDRIDGFSAPLEKLLLDESLRLSLERPCPIKLDLFTWKYAANMLEEIYKHWPGRGHNSK